MIRQNKNIMYIGLATALVLLIPLIAMQFTSEVNWTLGDFVIAGTLLFGTGLTYELIARKVVNPSRRALLGIILAFGLLLVWADLAVGIFNIPGISGS